MVMDFSTEDKAGGIKYCTAVHRRPRQHAGHSHDVHNDYPLALEQMSVTIGMCGYTSVPEDRHTCGYICFILK